MTKVEAKAIEQRLREIHIVIDAASDQGKADPHGCPWYLDGALDEISNAAHAIEELLKEAT